MYLKHNMKQGNLKIQVVLGIDLSSVEAYSSYWNLATALYNNMAVVLVSNHLHKNIPKQQQNNCAHEIKS